MRVREDAPRLYTRGLWEVFEKRDSNVDSVEDGTAVISTGPHIIAIPLKYLIKVEEEKKEAKYTKTKGDTLTFPIAFDLTDSYWAAYAADLAKEVALKVANKFNAPEQAAEYAVSVAKGVVEGLKRK